MRRWLGVSTKAGEGTSASMRPMEGLLNQIQYKVSMKSSYFRVTMSIICAARYLHIILSA